MKETTPAGHAIAIMDAFCLKAQYRPGETVTVRVELANECAVAVGAILHVTVTRLATPEEARDVPLDALAPGRSSLEVTIPPRAATSAAYASYGIELSLLAECRELARASAAFDVSADGRDVIRYGFLSRFDKRDGGSDADVDFLLRLHVTDVQLYDWMYRHDTLLPPQALFSDLMGKPISLDVVREKIDGCHARGMRALAYVAVYAASGEFRDAHPDWGLYDGAGQPYNLIGRFFIMDIARGSPWTRHLLAQFAAAHDALRLDGFHLDSYGFPKRALAHPGGAGTATSLRRHDEDFPAFIEAARDELGGGCMLIFNNVNGWPVEATAGAPQDAVYIEVWSPNVRYHHLAEMVRRARRLGGAKPIIMAAYLAPFRLAPGSADAGNAARILMTALAALGAQHLLFGEEQGVLTQGYYVDFSPLAPEFVPVLARYSDFLVRYSELLFDPLLKDVTVTHLGGDFPAYTLSGVPVSCWAEPGTVWPIVRESRSRKMVCLVNLVGNASDVWNEGKSVPEPQDGLSLEVAVHGTVHQAWWASPEDDAGRPRQLAFDLRATPTGSWLHVRVPTLRWFGILVVEAE